MDNKIIPQTLKGFRDFLPPEAIKRNYLRQKIAGVFESYGFDPLETPALEYYETFQGQIGSDEKLIFKFTDRGEREVALRYDQTVTTCRVLAQYQNDIPLPFKRYQIASVWRAENPQKGRYREFLQCDTDIFGVQGPEADAEVIALSMDIYQTLGFKEVKCLINDRSLYKDIPYSVIVSIDKLKKIGRENVIKEITAKGFPEEEAKKYLDTVINFQPNDTIKRIVEYLKTAGFPDSWYKFEPTLARSFNYSTGPIWEIEIPGFESGSVLGGERYDKLVGTFSNQSIPATGFGLGFDRTLEAMAQFGLIKTPETVTRVLVTVFSPDLYNKSLEITIQLRKSGINTDLYNGLEIKLDKQLKYADRKGIPYVIVIGPNEIQNNEVTVKNLQTKEQKTIPQNELLNILPRS